jgi:hypothetical protein
MPDLDVAPLLVPAASFCAGFLLGVTFCAWLAARWLLQR